MEGLIMKQEGKAHSTIVMNVEMNNEGTITIESHIFGCEDHIEEMKKCIIQHLNNIQNEKKRNANGGRSKYN